MPLAAGEERKDPFRDGRGRGAARRFDKELRLRNERMMGTLSVLADGPQRTKGLAPWMKGARPNMGASKRPLFPQANPAVL